MGGLAPCQLGNTRSHRAGEPESTGPKPAVKMRTVRWILGQIRAQVLPRLRR